MSQSRALSISGKPVQKGDFVSVTGQIVSISGTGPNAAATIKAHDTGATFTIPTRELHASQSL
jgi:hypothetical protein